MEVKTVDGFLMPVRDEDYGKVAVRDLEYLRELLDLTERRRSVFQAGGCVGVWAKELSKHFRTVYTMEPDPDNFHCQWGS